MGRPPLPGEQKKSPVRVSEKICPLGAWLARGQEIWPWSRRLRAWLAYKRLTGLSFPRRFPIVQFPNLPLIVAVLAGAAGKFLDGSAHSYAASVSYLAMTIWAYEELVHGVNWFRRLLGLAYVIFLIVRVADALRA
jgi:hypothetical protein